MISRSELKACPSCGSNDKTIFIEDHGRLTRIYCDSCGFSTKRCETQIEAIVAWETAPAPLDVEVAHCYVPREWWERLKAAFEREAEYWQGEAEKNGNDQFALGNCSGFRNAISSIEKLIKLEEMAKIEKGE